MEEKYRKLSEKLRKFSDDVEKQICDEYVDGSSRSKLSKKYDVGNTAISRILKRGEIKARPTRKKLDESQEKEVCEKYLSGNSMADITRIYDVNIAVVRRILKGYNIKIRQRGELDKDMGAKLDKNQKEEICEKYLLGDNKLKLGREYGVNSGTILRILREKGIKSRRLREFSKDTEKQICKDYVDDKESLAVLAVKYDASKDAIGKILRKYNIKKNEEHLCRRVDIVGKKFGKLTVIEYHGTSNINERSVALWRCKCDCGKETVVARVYLKQGSTRSCGCLYKFPEGEAILNLIYRRYQRFAKNRDFSFDIVKSEFEKLIQKDCFYCGSPPSNKIDRCNVHYVYNGIDRVDSSKGYSLDNVVPCCITCNWAKRDTPLDEFMIWINKLVKSHSNLKRKIKRFK